MKMGLIGHGYWGKILERNLPSLSQIYDPVDHQEKVLEKLLSTCDYVFIASPTSTHYEVVKQALENDCHVFCEKPLTLSVPQVNKLAKIAKKKDLKLHTDWIFTHHPVIQKILELQREDALGRLRKASMNRMNLGPFRNDVSSKWDLASHDISILTYLIEEEISLRVTEYDSHHSEMPGTCNILAEWAGGSAEINASWDYPSKCRSQTFVYDNAIVFWDDFRGICRINGKNFDHINECKPLERSIKFFLEESVENVNKNIGLTKRITSLLEKGIDA